MRREKGYTVKNISKAEILYKRHRMRGGRCKFRCAIKRKFNENNDDGN